MTEAPHVRPFRLSLAGIPEVLNSFREEQGLEPVESNRMLNFNAYDRAKHFIEAGVGQGELAETVRLFKRQDLSDGVELVSQWTAIEEPATYLSAWVKDDKARAVLIGDYRYVGVAGETIPIKSSTRPFLTAIVVMVLTNNHPNRP